MSTVTEDERRHALIAASKLFSSADEPDLAELVDAISKMEVAAAEAGRREVLDALTASVQTLCDMPSRWPFGNVVRNRRYRAVRIMVQATLSERQGKE